MKFMYKGKEFYINQTLAYQLDSIAWNLKKDWDFVILITGDRTVRVGKSVLGMTISAYLATALSRINKNDKPLNKDAYGLDHIFFDNAEMMKKAQELPPHSIIHYDEGREGLAASKAMKSFQQDLMDFFAECGQLNHIFVIVCPDFFELKENMAVPRSEFLINVYRITEKKMMDVYRDGTPRPISVLKRGRFQFFNRENKSELFDASKRKQRKNYRLWTPNFIGSFTNQFTIDEELYTKAKRESLSRFAERHEEQKTQKSVYIIHKVVISLHKQGKSTKEIQEFLEKELEVEYSDRNIQKVTHNYKEMIRKEQNERDLREISSTSVTSGGFDRNEVQFSINRTERDINGTKLG